MPSRPSGDPGIPDLRALRSVLPERSDAGRNVALLGYDDAGERLGLWRAELADDRVTVLGPGTLAELVDRLRRLGPVDLLVDLLTPDRLPAGCLDHGVLLRTLLPHLRKGGAFVHDRVAAPGELPDLAAISDHVAVVATTHDLVVIGQRHRHVLMLREADVPDVLVAREPALAVDELAVLPAGDFPARTTVHHHGEPPAVAPMESVIHHPRLALRHYRGPVAMSGRTLMWSGSTVLPDSFRWHLADQLGNPHLDDPADGHARMRRRHVPKRLLDGDLYQLESSYPSHFGHVLTEVVSRMWGWDEARRRLPALRLLVHPRRRFDNVVERAVIAAFGIADEDVVSVAGPVEVGSVVSASPMWHNAPPHYVHPDIAAVWDRIGEGLRPHESGIETSDRLFVSRSDATANNARICRNLKDVERRFEARGFTVLYPEQHPIADQARLFREARVVAGFGGSALFNVMHTRRLDALVVLNHDAYFARNEHLFASVKGGESHYFWSPPDSRPDDPFGRDALRASWEFDERRLGAELDALLARL